MPETIQLKTLGDIADIRMGYTFRKKIKEISRGGNAHVAQIKDVRAAWEKTGESSLQASQLPLINWQGRDTGFAEPGAVLLPCRGAKGGYFRASCLIEDSKSKLPLVVSSQFLILTPKQEVMPEFLCWSLNRAKIQHWISEGAGSQGTSLVMLKAENAKELKLKIPDLGIQEKILRINKLWEKEQQLTLALLKNRETMLQGMYQKLLKEKNS